MSLVPPVLQPGLIALHGNRAEDLAEAVVRWLGAHPLEPLEEEVVLVQSNGMGEWFKMEMARHLGVCAAVRVELPARFMWRTYRQVLGAQAVPLSSPLDTVPMTWRLMRVLQACEGPSAGEGTLSGDMDGLRRYLQPGDADRRFQLAQQLADLFDQYQNHRTDWLLDWAAGRDVLRRSGGAPCPLPADQRWQAVLWRQVLDTLDDAQRSVIRPALHQQVLDRLAQGAGVARVARRVVVFGMGHLPSTTLAALAALSAHSQVVMAVPNPCRYDWGDIIDGRELLHSLRRRHAAKGGVALAGIGLQDMHQHAHPLLAAWGRQGRDFIRQLDAFDDAQATQARFPQVRIDLFDTSETGPDTPVLSRVQQRIRDLEPVVLGAAAEPWPAEDRSIVFHVAHSPVRELEVLHDQLLDLLAQQRAGQVPLQPRDVVVMVPDIGAMAPAIRAVFGQYPRLHPRHIPFDIADLGARDSNPLVAALETVLRLPTERLGLSDLQDLLAVPAVARRLGVDVEQLPLLMRWMTEAGVRWGLDQAHRAGLGLAVCGEQNTVLFGLQRLLLGYACGPVPAGQRPDGLVGWADMEPVDEVGGLESAVLGGLAEGLRVLSDWWALCRTPATPEVWAERARHLLKALFQASDDGETQVLAALDQALTEGLVATEAAGCDEALPLSVFRRAWLDGLEAPRLDRRFRAGGVTFCTLMPMRAIPFEVVCLVGMNGADYPRQSTRNGWDLMALPGVGQPGDRSRQQDDRQLMLEALLSARRCLYISWAGHSVRDNTEQPPSVLVSQLRDHLSAVWGPGLVDACTTVHPLQPFSRRYFEQGSGLHTHVLEWGALHRVAPAEAAVQGWTPLDAAAPLDWRRLLSFFRNPVRAYMRDRMGVFFDDRWDEVPDTELFDMDGLVHHQWVQAVVAQWPLPQDSAHLPAHLSEAVARLQRAGQLPVGVWGDQVHDTLVTELGDMAHAWQALGGEWPQTGGRWPTVFEHQGVTLQGWLEPVCGDGQRQAWVAVSASALFDSKGRLRQDRLLEPWVRAVVAAASQPEGQPGLHGVLVARDAQLHVAPMAPDLARATLSTWLEIWWTGMQQPLPLPPKTAMACARGEAMAVLRDTYEETPVGVPEGRDMYLSRVYPDLASLYAWQGPDGLPGFEALAERVYAPLIAWAATDLSVQPYRQP